MAMFCLGQYAIKPLKSNPLQYCIEFFTSMANEDH